MGKIKVLIVDDSAIVRKIFTEVISRQSDLDPRPDVYAERVPKCEAEERNKLDELE